MKCILWSRFYVSGRTFFQLLKPIQSVNIQTWHVLVFSECELLLDCVILSLFSVCVLGSDVMCYGVYVIKVVCNFSPCHWPLPAYSWKRHLASCAAAGWSLTGSVVKSKPHLWLRVCWCATFGCVSRRMGVVKLAILKVHGSSIYWEAKWQVQRLQLKATLNYYCWGWKNDN